MSLLKASQKNREIAIYTPLGQSIGPDGTFEIIEPDMDEYLSATADEDVFLLHNFNYHEELGKLFSIQAEMFSEHNDISFEDMLGQRVTVRLNLPHEEIRYINGFVTHFSQGEPKRGFATYHTIISPWFWLLTRTSDCRIFQNMTVPDIIEEIFAKHEFAEFESRLTAPYREWEYCVQYRETDFNFVSRLMEQEGIYYFFEHTIDTHTLIMADAPGAHEPVPDYEEIPYYPPDSTVVRDHEYVSSWSVNKQIQPGVVALDDFNFKMPRADISTLKEKDEGHQSSLLELFDYPGEYTEVGEGEFYNDVRLQELHAQYQTIHGSSNARGIYAGGLFSLIKHHRDDRNREYLITSVSHRVQQDLYSSSQEQITPFIHTNHLEVVSSETLYRSKRDTPKPTIQGVQTATVVGPPGEEIYTDEFGRIKCQFHWDRYGEMNQDSSCWIRVSQMWAGKEWGHIALPRIGQEVIVDFIEGDPDRPIITGRTYNADNMPPYALDDMKTRMTIKSDSYMAEGFNEMRFEDRGGEEEIFIHAQKDQNNVVLNNETTEVGVDRTENIGHDETITIGNNRTEMVGGDENITIAGNRDEVVAKNEEITINGARAETIGKTQTLTVEDDIIITSTKGSISLVTQGASITLTEDGRIIIFGKEDIDIDGTEITLN